VVIKDKFRFIIKNQEKILLLFHHRRGQHQTIHIQEVHFLYPEFDHTTLPETKNIGFMKTQQAIHHFNAVGPGILTVGSCVEPDVI
jgi:hypothetical protein